MEDADLSELVRAEAEHSERTMNDPMPKVAGKRRNQAGSVVYSVRLTPEDVARLEKLAEERDIPASALVRGFVLRGLAEQEPSTVTTAVERVAAEVHRLQELVGR